MTEIVRLTAFYAPGIKANLVPVEIPQKHPANKFGHWNSRVFRWHRRAGR